MRPSRLLLVLIHDEGTIACARSPVSLDPHQSGDLLLKGRWLLHHSRPANSTADEKPHTASAAVQGSDIDSYMQVQGEDNIGMVALTAPYPVQQVPPVNLTPPQNFIMSVV